jgi:hypothetical protein
MNGDNEQFPLPERLNSEWLGGSAYRLWRALAPTWEEWEEGVPRVYITSDLYTLYRMAGLETIISRFVFEPEMSVEEQRIAYPLLHDALAVYHEALPFSEGERRWLTNACNNFEECPVAEEVIREDYGEIVSGGLRRVIQGGDLIRRWWSWRRHTDEFQGQDTVTVAKIGLARIAQQFMPKPLPEDLRDAS